MTNLRVDAIRKRHELIEAMEPSTQVNYVTMLQDAHRDRGELLAYIASLQPVDEPEDDEPVTYDIEDAIRIAGLWRAGKMIGGDEDGVRDALLAEIEKLRVEPSGEQPRFDVRREAVSGHKDRKKVLHEAVGILHPAMTHSMQCLSNYADPDKGPYPCNCHLAAQRTTEPAGVYTCKHGTVHSCSACCWEAKYPPERTGESRD